MSQNFIIPNNPTNASNQSDITIHTLGLGLLKTEIFKGAIPTGTKDKELAKSKMLGTSVFSNLTIKGRAYTDIEGNTSSFPDIVLETVLFNVAQQKTILTTPVQGRKTTVKEFISDGDYAITIKGIITGNNGNFPMDDMVAFIKMVKAPISVDVSSWFLQLFDIYQIVVFFAEFMEEEGHYSDQKFEIQAHSDEPIQLYIDKN